MPTIEPANIQQVIQMGSHVEKVQQTIQQQQGVLAQQLNIEGAENDDVKKNRVQEPENAYQSDASNPDDKGKRGRLISQSESSITLEIDENNEQPPPVIVEQNHGGNINLWV